MHALFPPPLELAAPAIAAFPDAALETLPPWLTGPWAIAAGLNAVLLGLVAIAPKKLLTPAGIVHAWILGVAVWGCLGWPGYGLLCLYFAVGSAVTRVGLARKEAAGIAEKRSGARGPENVWGSASTAAACAIALGWLSAAQFGTLPAALPGAAPDPSGATALLWLGYVASFSTKLSDTCASEIGKAYGRRTFSIVTFTPVAPGTEGAVSLEGTLAGVAGSLAIAGAAWGLGAVDGWGLLWCAIAAFAATAAESAIGATVQDRFDWLTNEVVNGINTAIGAALAIGLGAIAAVL